ncbi:hypothetical protein PINS_up000786 [Pythium insidiosum]|nr:hypothetical protein PINS_up000786 [Pythium insidiosum]
MPLDRGHRSEKLDLINQPQHLSNCVLLSMDCITSPGSLNHISFALFDSMSKKRSPLFTTSFDKHLLENRGRPSFSSPQLPLSMLPHKTLQPANGSQLRSKRFQLHVRADASLDLGRTC